MSIVSLKNVKVYATFKSGFRVVDESTVRNGETFKQRFTVWADPIESGPIREGDIVSLSGFLSARVNDWTDKDGNEKHSVELSVNKPRIERAEATEEPPADGWYTATPVDDTESTPF